MQARNVNGFTSAAVDRAFQGLDLPFESRVRAELLNLDNVKLIDLKGLQLEGSITHNTDQPIKRGAELHFKETSRDSQHANPLGTFASIITAQNRLFHLRMNETSGNFADFTGNGRTFTAHGSPTYSIGTLTPGDPLNNAVTFTTAAADYGDIADAAWMDTTPITLSAWVRFTSASPLRLMQRDETSNQAWVIGHNTTNGLFFRIFIATVNTQFNSGKLINDGLAHHIVCMYDGINIQIYIDGARALKTAQTGNIDNVAARITVPGFAAILPTTVDEVGMLSRILTPKEIRDEYQAGSSQLNELLLDRDRGDRVKIWYGVRMASAGTDGTTWAEWPQIVAVMTSPKRNYSPTGIIDSITCQDQTRILADDKFTIRTTLASGANYISGTNGVIAIAQSSGFDTSAWSITSTALTAPADVDFEIGSSKLDAINYLLLAINYRQIRFAGDGTAIIEPNVLDKDRTTVDTLASGTTSVISAEELAVEIEQRRVINEVIVFNGNPDATPVISVAINNKARSGTSTVYVSTQPKSVQVDIADQTTADGLAGQILSDETMRWAKRVRMRTLPRPIHDDRDRLRLTMSELGIDADYVEDEWQLPLNPLEMMSHNFLSVIDVTT